MVVVGGHFGVMRALPGSTLQRGQPVVNVPPEESGGECMRKLRRFEAEVSSDTMLWGTGVSTDNGLSIELAFAANTIRGEGLNNRHTNGWAYGSFQFTCEGG